MTSKFGVEIEHYGLGNAARCAETLNNTGFPVRESYYHAPTSRDWKVAPDGSVYGGAELISPPLPFNATGLNEAREAILALKANGAYVDSSCGLHVHVDQTFVSCYTRSQQEAYFAFFLKAFQSVESKFTASIKANRRNGSYCRNVAGMTLAQVRRERYSAINFQAYDRHGTIEFRQLQGCLNDDALIAWVTLCVTFCRNVRAAFEKAHGIHAEEVYAPSLATPSFA